MATAVDAIAISVAITDLRAAGNPLIYVNQVCYNI